MYISVNILINIYMVRPKVCRNSFVDPLKYNIHNKFHNNNNIDYNSRK